MGGREATAFSGSVFTSSAPRLHLTERLTGELFSVSPWVAKRAENLFVLNERVALLGRWRHGFFGMVPVGATNVGSIKINFDQARNIHAIFS